MKKFKYFYPLSVYLTLIVFSLLIVANFVLTIISLFEIFPVLGLWYDVNLAPYNILASFIAFSIALSFLQTKYVVGEKLTLYFGLVNTLKDCQVKLIYNAVVKNNNLYISYKLPDQTEPVIVHICINPAQFDDFLALLKQRNPIMEITKDE
ncbi:MAG: hypothetical protein J6R37_01175 [Clostridia bacterium]|nr:hypothetical protein [Clostridia bacterium]